MQISKMDQAITLALHEIRYFRNYDRRCVQVIIAVVVLLWLVLLAMFVLADIDAAVVSRRVFVLSGALAMFLVKGTYASRQNNISNLQNFNTCQ